MVRSLVHSIHGCLIASLIICIPHYILSAEFGSWPSIYLVPSATGITAIFSSTLLLVSFRGKAHRPTTSPLSHFGAIIATFIPFAAWTAAVAILVIRHSAATGGDYTNRPSYKASLAKTVLAGVEVLLLLAVGIMQIIEGKRQGYSNRQDPTAVLKTTPQPYHPIYNAP